ncbi:MAG: phosphoglycerate mutase family protein [Proteobacteria bacterium]|nr:phosphoglycerate mutase family protein [Pseudomonadota bacterium]NBP15073.1 phosphoglycerate mutase family protein [bacterium]
MNVNIAFVRHGYGCHNALRPLIRSEFLKPTITMEELQIHSDPELTPLGVDASIHNGCVVAKMIRNAWKTNGNRNYQVDSVNLVGCSPLIRSMETAYYMTRKWKNPPNKIYVLPYLREIDESSPDKYSPHSRAAIDTIPSYRMKTIAAQKEYLRKGGILQFFDFSFVETDPVARSEPGDILTFNKWLSKVLLPRFQITTSSFNLFIVTHAGVLRDFSGQGHYNNSGFLVNLSIDPDKPSKFPLYNFFFPLDQYLPPDFFSNYSDPEYTDSKYFCPSGRCGQLCAYSNNHSNNHNNNHNNSNLKRITPKCNNDPENNL